MIINKSYWIVLASVLLSITGCSALNAASDVIEAIETPPVVEQQPAEQEAQTEEAAPEQEQPAEQPTTAEPAVEEEAPVSVPEGAFVVVSGESEARFRIGEILTGEYNEVVGATRDVAGQIAADYGNPAAASVIFLQVDLSTLATDSGMRDRTMKNNFLETGNPDYRYAEFVSTNLIDVPDTVTIGQPFDLQIVGELTIHGVTREVAFDATVTPVSETRLEGSASVTVLWSDFGIQVLRLPPQVASIEDEVILEIDLVAESQ